MKQKVLRLTAVAIALVFIIITMASCTSKVKQPFDVTSIKSYRDIPGITAEEIAAIEALKSSRESFSYGSLLSTEAFILPDGTYAGFTTMFCELLSDLFGIPFVQEFQLWDYLKNGIDEKAIDFTGNLTPTPERLLFYYMTHPITERSLRIFTYGSDLDIKSEDDVNGLRIGFLEESITAKSIINSYPSLNFEIVSVQNTQDVIEMFRSGLIDAFVDEAIESYTFIHYPFINSQPIFPLVYTPISLTTANPEFKPIISVMDKYIFAGGIYKLYELYKAGNYEYARYILNVSFFF
jgi:ABC-type amino acid transport substrate-binding protein